MEQLSLQCLYPSGGVSHFCQPLSFEIGLYICHQAHTARNCTIERVYVEADCNRFDSINHFPKCRILQMIAASSASCVGQLLTCRILLAHCTAQHANRLAAFVYRLGLDACACHVHGTYIAPEHML